MTGREVGTLVLLRPAKSAWPEGVPDHERPLAGRGRRDAPEAGRWLRQAGLELDLALCSTALRARQTWELASAELDTAPPVRLEAGLYRADADELLAVVHTLRRVRTVLLVAHNPGIHDLALTLAGDGYGDALQRVALTYPTSAIAVLVFAGDWPQLAPGSAYLADFAVPRGPRTEN